MKNSSQQRRYVAKCDDSSKELHRGWQYSALNSINNDLLPLMRELGAADSTNIRDYFGIGHEQICALFYSYTLKRCSNEYEREMKRYSIHDDLRTFLSTHTIPAPQEMDEDAIRFVSYDHESKCFVMDTEGYEATFDIYTASPEEDEILKRVETLAEAMNALDLSGIPLHLIIRTENGDSKLASSIHPGLWSKLVTNSMKKL